MHLDKSFLMQATAWKAVAGMHHYVKARTSAAEYQTKFWVQEEWRTPIANANAQREDMPGIVLLHAAMLAIAVCMDGRAIGGTHTLPGQWLRLQPG